MNYTLASQGDCVNLNTIGGKGFNLIILSQGGFQVPNAFIVSEEAFREFCLNWHCSLEVNDEEPITNERIDKLQAQFDKYELKYELVAEIQNQLHDIQNNCPFPKPLLAVRSSGVMEDLDDASFAGMNDTILNVDSNVTAVCAAIKECWKSLFSYRSINYRIQHGFPALKTSIAVVIQVMIPSESSGVAFTADPQTGSRAHLSLDGVYGMGETLVSGQVNPHHWLIRKPYGKHDYFVEHESIPYQTEKLESNYPKPGTTKVSLSEEEGRTPCFSSSQLSMLVSTIIEIEKYYQKPMDIEFAFYSNVIYILQARPITNLIPIPNCINPLIHPYSMEWNAYINVGYLQMLTEQVSILGCSLFRTFFGVSEKQLIYVNGYIYMNISSFMTSCLVRKVSLLKLSTMVDSEMAQILKEIYKSDYSLYSHKEANQTYKSLKRTFIKPLIHKIIKSKFHHKDLEQVELQLTTLFNQMIAVSNSIEAILKEQKEQIQLKDILAIPFNFVQLLIEVKATIQTFYVDYLKLLKLAKKWNIDSIVIEKLVNNEKENMAKEMIALLCQLKKAIVDMHCEEVVQSLVTHQNKQEVDSWLSTLASSSSPAATQFLSLWSQFISTYGCRCKNEIDVASLRYYEQPYVVLSLILNINELSILTEEEVTAVRNSVNSELESSLSPKQFKQIQKLLPSARLFFKYREHPKYYLVKVLSSYHEVFNTIGQSMVNQSAIETLADIYYLSVQDILWWQEGKISQDGYKQMISDIKSNMRLNNRDMPRVICLPECTMYTISKKTMNELALLPENVLVGTAASAGIIEGVAVVATSPDSVKLQKDEILIAKATDPSWTPLFANAAGVAVEIGGTLTHGSVVAKELGIPCVVGLPGLLSKIKTGMKIRVDGNKGIVEIM